VGFVVAFPETLFLTKGNHEKHEEHEKDIFFFVFVFVLSWFRGRISEELFLTKGNHENTKSAKRHILLRVCLRAFVVSWSRFRRHCS
jgi:hypothetical protein